MPDFSLDISLIFKISRDVVNFHVVELQQQTELSHTHTHLAVPIAEYATTMLLVAAPLTTEGLPVRPREPPRVLFRPSLWAGLSFGRALGGFSLPAGFLPPARGVVHMFRISNPFYLEKRKTK